MFEQAKYVNHLNEVVEFGKPPFFINRSDLRDYEWKYSTTNSRVSQFKKDISTKKLPVIATKDADLDAMYEVFEKDVLAGEFGKLYVGDYYILCNVYKSSKSDYLSKQYTIFTLDIVLNKTNWFKEIEYKFLRNAEEEAEDLTGIKAYDYGYPYDYGFSSGYQAEINNDAFTEADFRIIINGHAENPSIYIGENLYTVNVTVEAGGYLVIDSLERTVTLVNQYGQKSNAFMYRDVENGHYLFEKVAAGSNQVIWSGDFEFVVTLYDVRSEPKWN